MITVAKRIATRKLLAAFPKAWQNGLALPVVAKKVCDQAARLASLSEMLAPPSLFWAVAQCRRTRNRAVDHGAFIACIGSQNFCAAVFHTSQARKSRMNLLPLYPSPDCFGTSPIVDEAFGRIETDIAAAY
jgi:hypothetical protein